MPLQRLQRAPALGLPLIGFGDAPRTDDVWRLIVERARERTVPGRRTDTARVALAIEGGGMAGAISAGMCVALEALGLIASFDAIYGSSSGALNASYAASGQVRSRAGLYPRAAQARMVDPRRALRGRPPFGVAEIVNSLLCVHPHDRSVLDGAPPLRVTATRVADKAVDVLADFATVAEVRQAVWASCAIPVLAGDIVDFRGRRYVDGGLVESMPYHAALRDGATHVLVLRSRPPGYRFRDYPAATLRVVDRLLRDAPDTLPELIRERPARYNADAAALQSPPSELRGSVSQLAPPAWARLTSQFETRPGRLVEAIQLGAWTVHETVAPRLAVGHAGRRAAAVPAAASVAARAQ